jgi:hypothetical protein
MGCSSSKQHQQTDHRADAERYARRKKNGFKDSGLQRHVDACQKQKKKLRHVGDPAVAREKKQAQIQETQKKNAKMGGTGMTANELRDARANLKHH